MMKETDAHKEILLFGACNKDLKGQVTFFLLRSNIPLFFPCIMKLNWENVTIKIKSVIQDIKLTGITGKTSNHICEK